MYKTLTMSHTRRHRIRRRCNEGYMTATQAEEFRAQIDDDALECLSSSSSQPSTDPSASVGWDAPPDPDRIGMNPEWSTTYGTPLWDQMTHEQQLALTRHEAASVASIGIWFETLLQQ